MASPSSYTGPWSAREIALYENRIRDIDRKFGIVELKCIFRAGGPVRSYADAGRNDLIRRIVKLGFANARHAAARERFLSPLA